MSKKKIVWVCVGAVVGTVLLIIAALVVFFVLLVARGYDFVMAEDGRMSYGVSKSRKDVFCIGPEWEGGDLSFEIPDEFMGYPVTTLGGYTGRGYPCPFSARVNTADYGVENDGFTCDDKFFDYHHRADDEYETLVFSVRLGKNVRNLGYVDGKSYLGNYLENGGFDFAVKVVYFFTVDGENETFSAENGKLYYKASGELVDEFFYE